jgi:hypothetical protein
MAAVLFLPLFVSQSRSIQHAMKVDVVAVIEMFGKNKRTMIRMKSMARPDYSFLFFS